MNCKPGRSAERSGSEAPRPGAWEDTMTTEQKIIRAKVRLLELAKQLGNVSQACKVVGYNRDSFYRFKELYGSARTGAARNQPQEADPEELVALEIKDGVVALAIEQPALGQSGSAGAACGCATICRPSTSGSRSAGSKDGSGAYYPNRSATRRARNGEDRERGPWRVRKRTFRLLRRPGHLPPDRLGRSPSARPASPR